MAENKKSIIVYADWIKKFEVLSDEEAGKLIKHFFQYVNDLNPKAPDRITELSFIDIEQSLKRDLKKWEKRAERSRENGKMGGRPPKEENPEQPKETQQDNSEPEKPDTVNDTVSVTVNDIKDLVEEVEAETGFEILVDLQPICDLKGFVKNKFPKTEETLKMKVGAEKYSERQEAFILRNNERSYTSNNDFRGHYSNFILVNPPPERKEKSSAKKETKSEQSLSTYDEVNNLIRAATQPT